MRSEGIAAGEERAPSRSGVDNPIQAGAAQRARRLFKRADAHEGSDAISC